MQWQCSLVAQSVVCFPSKKIRSTYPSSSEFNKTVPMLGCGDNSRGKVQIERTFGSGACHVVMLQGLAE
jgi:hypothetical protein